MGVHATIVHFFKLASHGIPLKAADNNKSQRKHGNGSSKSNHPAIYSPYFFFEVGQTCLLWLTAYGCAGVGVGSP